MLKLQDMVRVHLSVSKRATLSLSLCLFSSDLFAALERTFIKMICFDVAGSNGMGQAQSQSSGAGCEDCYGGGSESTHGNCYFHSKSNWFGISPKESGLI